MGSLGHYYFHNYVHKTDIFYWRRGTGMLIVFLNSLYRREIKTEELSWIPKDKEFNAS